MAQPVLKCQHLGIQFGGLKAVDDFNMEIGESELVGLIGPNGADKTTVINLITGVYKPTEGSFYRCGERMDGKKTYIKSINNYLAEYQDWYLDAMEKVKKAKSIEDLFGRPKNAENVMNIVL